MPATYYSRTGRLDFANFLMFEALIRIRKDSQISELKIKLNIVLGDECFHQDRKQSSPCTDAGAFNSMKKLYENAQPREPPPGRDHFMLFSTFD